MPVLWNLWIRKINERIYIFNISEISNGEKEKQKKLGVYRSSKMQLCSAKT